MKISTRQITSSHDDSLQAVYFEYINPAARAVSIAGTFNDWRPQVTPMINMGNGRWRKVLVVAPGTYEYAFVVDGQWVDELRTTQTSDSTQSYPLPKRQPAIIVAEQLSGNRRSSGDACHAQASARRGFRYA